MKTSVTFSILIVIVLTACSSTSKLREYPIDGKRIAFLYRSEVDELSSSMWIDDPDPDTPWTGIVAALLSIFGTIAADESFDATVDPHGVASTLSEGIERSLIDRLGVEPVDPASGLADFVLTTRLRRLSLHSNADGVFLNVKVTEEMYSAYDSALVWEEDLTQSVPLRFHGSGIWHPTVMSVESVVSGVQLLAMEDEEVQDAVIYTAQESGYLLGDMIVHDARPRRHAHR
ncbi:hypothetical protein KQI65_04735 [bacterium]|nr:hypothetical protein [bacterium]